MKIMVEKLQRLRFGKAVKSTLLLFIVANFFCPPFPPGNALAEIQQANPERQLLLPSQNNHLILIVVEKTRRQENIYSNNNILFDETDSYRRHMHFAPLMIFATVTLSSYISNLLYTKTISSCL
jgi:hypothetical protein